jgi:hypothetical protein
MQASKAQYRSKIGTLNVYAHAVKFKLTEFIGI